ncbi:MAG: hypothetical protein Q8J87_02135 [Sediminibacterium sp.]|nr:hypothetical protein [Sediminibacterium sp.]
MKKIKLNASKLQLTKEKIASLSNAELTQNFGGGTSGHIPCADTGCGHPTYMCCTAGSGCGANYTGFNCTATIGCTPSVAPCEGTFACTVAICTPQPA